MKYNNEGREMPNPTQDMIDTVHPKRDRSRKYFIKHFDALFPNCDEVTVKTIKSRMNTAIGKTFSADTIIEQCRAMAYCEHRLVCINGKNSFFDPKSGNNGPMYKFRRLKDGEEWWSSVYDDYDKKNVEYASTESIVNQRVADEPTHKSPQQTVLETETEKDLTQTPTPTSDDWVEVRMKVPKEMYDIANDNAQMDDTEVGQFFFEHLDKDSIMTSTIPSYVKRAMEKGLNRLQAYIGYETYLEEIKKLKATTEE